MTQMLEFSNGPDFLQLCLGYKRTLSEYASRLEVRVNFKDPKEDFSLDQARLLCIAVNTFEYMAEEVPSLEKLAKRKIATALKDDVEMDSEREVFLDCAVRTVSFDFGFGILCCVLMG
jgi:hypothetical protein